MGGGGAFPYLVGQLVIISITDNFFMRYCAVKNDEKENVDESMLS